jgi:hypothetical protein
MNDTLGFNKFFYLDHLSTLGNTSMRHLSLKKTQQILQRKSTRTEFFILVGSFAFFLGAKKKYNYDQSAEVSPS